MSSFETFEYASSIHLEFWTFEYSNISRYQNPSQILQGEPSGLSSDLGLVNFAEQESCGFISQCTLRIHVDIVHD